MEKRIGKKKKEDVDQLHQNYLKMDEVGKEKLKDVSEKILEIYNTVNEKKDKTRE